MPPFSVDTEEGGNLLPAPASPSSPAGTLFVVSLPIGDPEDITLRALKVLRNVHLIVGEDPRIAQKALHAYDIATEIVSLLPRRGVPALSAALAQLEAGHNVALIADSGTPTVEDPGLRLIQAAIGLNHRVTAIPGASACLAALVLSGLPSTPFQFAGFPPRRHPERGTFFTKIAASGQTTVLYESHRYLRSTLSELGHHLGDLIKIVVGCDLTHTNERIFRGTILSATIEFADNTPICAYTLVISGISSSVGS